MTIQVDSPKVYTIQGVPLSVTGIAQVLCIFFYFCYFLVTSINYYKSKIKTNSPYQLKCRNTI